MKISDSSAPTAISLSDIVFTYPRQQFAVELAHWEVEQGAQIFLHGPSGSGKTTLLNLLCGILTPKRGKVALLGEVFSDMTTRKRDRFRARHIGVVFQQFNLIPHLNVMKNIALAAHFAGNKSDVSANACKLVTSLKLPESVLDSQVKNLSVGQQQRVAIARALINKPEILLVDEPTSALDADARDSFMSVLLSLCRQHNITLIFVSHDTSLAEQFADKVSIEKLVYKKENTAC